MRLAWLVALGLLLQVSWAQSWSRTWYDAFRTLGKEDRFRVAEPRKPPTPAGFPSPPSQKLPEPLSKPEDPKRIIVHSADHFDHRDGHVKATGNVKVSYRGYDMMGDRLEGSTRTEIFVLSGRAVLIGKDHIARGDVIRIDYKAQTFRFENGDAQLGPEFVKGNLVDPLYIKSKEGGGSQQLSGYKDCELTTCNLKVPHFHLDSRDTVVRPGKRAILRDAAVVILGKTILRIPYLVVPLERYSERYIPEVGHSSDEGYYIKTRWSTPLKGDNLFDTHLDYYTKQGNGLGFTFFYDNPKLAGKLHAYTLTRGTRGLVLTSDHRQRLFGGELVFTGNYTRNNYLTAPSTQTLSSNAQYIFRTRTGTSRLSYYRSSNETNNFKSVNETFGLSDQHNFGRSTSTSIDLNYVTNFSQRFGQSNIARNQLDVRFTGRHELWLGPLLLEYRRSIPVGTSQNFFSSVDQTPYLTFQPDGLKLFGRRFGLTWPTRLQFEVGELVESSSVKVTKMSFDAAVNRTEKFRPGSRTTWTWGSRFVQRFYSDDTAQYILGFNSNFRYRFRQNSSYGLTYTYLRPEGFTPLNLDRLGQTDLVQADASYAPGPAWLFSVYTGFDGNQIKQKSTPWQNLSFQGQYQPSRKFEVRTQATYDTFRQLWSTLRLESTWFVSGAEIVAGLRYDGDRHTWASANLLISGFQTGNLKTSLLLSYNGYLKQFESRQIAFVYDLHCAEAILQLVDYPVGFRSGREISFFIRLKALPWDTAFGVGRRGQAIGIGSGVGTGR